MNTRQSKLLVAIIDQFIATASPVGSERLLAGGEFCVSSATIRSEMGNLEDEGYLEQPHISAGRIPTAKGYRVYVKEFLKPSVQERKVRQKFESLKEMYLKKKDQERVYEAVALLAHMTPHVAFGTVPHKQPGIYYLGLANTLRQPEFRENPVLASGVVEVLENRISDLLHKVTIDEQVRYYIGGEDLLPEIQSCSLLVIATQLRGTPGVLGILGPMRMDYAYNTVALELIADLLRSA
jgi:heat-inducible transcriptional repressor